MTEPNTRILLDIKHTLDYEPIDSVRLSPRNAVLASQRIKATQNAMTPFPPAWAAFDAPPARRFLGVELIEDESMPEGWMRARCGNRLWDVRLTPIGDEADGG